MSYIDVEALLAPRATTGSGFPEDDVEVPGIGMVRVRGLSRHEVIHVQGMKGVHKVEQVTVSLGLLQPAVTEDQVARWQKICTGGELDPVTRRIGQLSGMLPDAAKRAYEDFEADPGSEFRVPPGPETGDDGVADASGDAS